MLRSRDTAKNRMGFDYSMLLKGKMELTGSTYQVTGIQKATKRQFFRDIKKGDKFTVSTKLTRLARGNTHFTIKNITQKTKATVTQNVLVGALQLLFYTEI